MKVTIDVDVSASEAPQFLGLPDVQSTRLHGAAFNARPSPPSPDKQLPARGGGL